MESGLSLEHLVQNFKTLNTVLATYIDTLHTLKVHIRHARFGILGLQHFFPDTKGKLTRAWNGIKSWEQTLDKQCRLPMPLLVMQGMALLALSRGLSLPSEAHLMIVFSVLLRTAFWGLLRPAVVMKLRAKDVGQQNTPSDWITLVLINPKNTVRPLAVISSVESDAAVLLLGLCGWLVVYLPNAHSGRPHHSDFALSSIKSSVLRDALT